MAAIALERRLNTNLLFKWRRDHLRELARQAPMPTMLLVTLEPSPMVAEAPRSRVMGGIIDIELAAGRVRLKGGGRCRIVARGARAAAAMFALSAGTRIWIAAQTRCLVSISASCA